MTGLEVAGGEPHAADRAILNRVAGGDPSALATLYDRHGRGVYSLACRIVTDRADAEDVVQEVFTQAWQQASRYDQGRATVTGWLLMMTRARAIDRVRARAARRRRRTRPTRRCRTCRMRDRDMEAEAISAESAARLRQALGDLPEAQRRTIELAYYEGLTQTDIAEKLQEPLGTVKTRMRSALQKLRAALQVGGDR